MSYLSVLRAVQARLQGESFFHVPPFPGPDLDGAMGRVSVAQEFRTVNVAVALTLQVPLLFFGVEGARTNVVYPSLSYEIIDYTPRYDEYVHSDLEYGGDVYREEIAASAETVLDSGTDLGASPRMFRERALEHPMDILVEIRAHADDPVVSALLVEYVYDRFPPRHFIRVPMKDGSHKSWDMLFVNYQDLDQREAVRAGLPGVEREYAKAWTYKVEGYFDNTDTAVLRNTVRKRSFVLHRTG